MTPYSRKIEKLTEKEFIVSSSYNGVRDYSWHFSKVE